MHLSRSISQCAADHAKTFMLGFFSGTVEGSIWNAVCSDFYVILDSFSRSHKSFKNSESLNIVCTLLCNMNWVVKFDFHRPVQVISRRTFALLFCMAKLCSFFYCQDWSSSLNDRHWLGRYKVIGGKVEERINLLIQEPAHFNLIVTSATV